MTNIKEYISLLKRLHVDLACFTRLYPSGRASTNYKKLSPTKKEFHSVLNIIHQSDLATILQGAIDPSTLDMNIRCGLCRALITEIAIFPDGTLTPCPSDPTSLGNIFTHNIQKLAVKGRTHWKNCAVCERFSN